MAWGIPSFRPRSFGADRYASVWLADVREMPRYMFMLTPVLDAASPVLTGMDIVRPPRDQ